MIRQIEIILTMLLALTACSNPTVHGADNQAADTIVKELTTQNITDSVNGQRDIIQKDNLPIHGKLNQKQIDEYYPNIIDTVKDRRIIGSEPINLHTETDIYVSLLHNTGTFDQMFLCTHDKSFKLIDCYYVGTSIMFDKTSHTIEYKKTNDDHRIEFHHIDWGYVKNKIDTLKYTKDILTVTKTGNIEKQ